MQPSSSSNALLEALQGPKERASRDVESILASYHALATQMDVKRSLEQLRAFAEHVTAYVRTQGLDPVQVSAVRWALRGCLSWYSQRDEIKKVAIVWKKTLEVSRGVRVAELYTLLEVLLGVPGSFAAPVARREIFRWTTAVGGEEDVGSGMLRLQLRVLIALTGNGKDISPFEVELGDVFANWMTNRFDEEARADMRDLIALLIRIYKSYPFFLSTENKSLLLQRACVVANGLRYASQLPVVESCLSLLEALVEHGVGLPPFSLFPIISCLCRTVNTDTLCDQSWRIGRGLLSSRAYGLETFLALSSLLTKKEGATSTQGGLLRGAVFFMGMSCWGKDKVDLLEFSPVHVLSVFATVVKCGHAVVAYEVLLSVRRLIRKQAKQLLVEWSIIFDILGDMVPYVHPSAQMSLVRVLVDTLQTVQVLASEPDFLGDADKFHQVLEEHSHLMPPPVSLRLLQAQLSRTTLSSWEDRKGLLQRSLRQHLLSDLRSEPRLAALASIQNWLSHKPLGAGVAGDQADVVPMDDLRVQLLVPIWADMLLQLLATPPSQERVSLLSVLKKVCQYAAEAATMSRKDSFCSCLDVLASAISAPTVASFDGFGDQKVSLSRTTSRSDNSVKKLAHYTERNALLGLALDDAACEAIVVAFRAELAAGRSWRARYVFSRLVALLHHPVTHVRHRTVLAMETLRASPDCLLVVEGNVTQVRVQGPGIGGDRRLKDGENSLDLSIALDMMADQLRVEVSKGLHAAILATLYEWFVNGYILEGAMLDRVVDVICAVLQTNLLPKPFQLSEVALLSDALEHVKATYQLAMLLIGYVPSKCSNPSSKAAMLLDLFIRGLKTRYDMFSSADQEALQYVCMNAICILAGHFGEIACEGATRILEALFGLPRKVMALALRFLASVSGFSKQVPFELHCRILRALVQFDHGAEQDVREARSLLMTAVAWLSCVVPAQRPACYSEILPFLCQKLGGPLSNLVESKLDALSHIAFLRYAPSCAPVAKPSERFLFAGRESVLLLQGNMLLEVVCGHSAWILVTVRRACGSFQWIMRTQNDLVSMFGGVLPLDNRAVIFSYPALERTPSVQALSMAKEAPRNQKRKSKFSLSDEPYSSLNQPPLLSVSSLAVPLDDATFASGAGGDSRVSPPSSQSLSPQKSVSVGRSVKPLMESGHLEFSNSWKEIGGLDLIPQPLTPKARQSIDKGAAMPIAVAEEGFELDLSLRMGPLLPYEDDAAVDEDEGSIFSGHSLDGTRQSSTMDNQWEHATRRPSIKEENKRKASLAFDLTSASSMDDDDVVVDGEKVSLEESNSSTKPPVSNPMSPASAITPSVRRLDSPHVKVSPVLLDWESQPAVRRAAIAPVTPPPRQGGVDCDASNMSVIANSEEVVTEDGGGGGDDVGNSSAGGLACDVSDTKAELTVVADHPENDVEENDSMQGKRERPRARAATVAHYLPQPAVLDSRTIRTRSISSPIGADESSSSPADYLSASALPLEAPHSSLLLMQLRYVPFTDEAPKRIQPIPAIKRAINVLDYMYPVQTYKLGVVYVGPHQKEEEEIMSNTHGSLLYTDFLRSLGPLVRLKGFKGYTGGLDTERDQDGALAIHVRNELAEIIFHVATLMPDTDNSFLQKKRHIANCNVLVVWNESRAEFKPASLSGDLNLVQVIVTPIGDSVALLRVLHKREPDTFMGIVGATQVVHIPVLSAVVVSAAMEADNHIAEIMGHKPSSGSFPRLEQIKKLKNLWNQHLDQERLVEQQLREKEKQEQHKREEKQRSRKSMLGSKLAVRWSGAKK